jgi:hypothetical protein
MKPGPATAALAPSAEDQAVGNFFRKFVVYPCSNASTPGFLEHLPSLFKEVSANNRSALRYAVLAAAYASISREQNNLDMGNRAMKCYGLALSALRKALELSTSEPDDYVLMTIVILDLFEASLSTHVTENVAF